jgi:hypothetical protein
VGRVDGCGIHGAKDRREKRDRDHEQQDGAAEQHARMAEQLGPDARALGGSGRRGRSVDQGLGARGAQ